jgi:hypothetical protein
VKQKRIFFEVRWNAEHEVWSIYRDRKLWVPDGVIGHADKEAATVAARLEARECRPSELVVKTKSGRISTRATYGNDPKGRG